MYQIDWEGKKQRAKGKGQGAKGRIILDSGFWIPISIFFLSNIYFLFPASAQSLPPPGDTPEEILRTEIYTEARSPIDGRLLATAEYIEEQEKTDALLQRSPEAGVSPELKRLINLLKLRKTIRQFLPLIP